MTKMVFKIAARVSQPWLPSGKIKALFAFMLGLSTLTVCAERGSGTYSNDFSGAVNLWDISGAYSQSKGFESEDYIISVDPSGVITGLGNFHYDDDTNILGGVFTISGQVKSAGPTIRAGLTLSVTNGTGTVDGTAVTFTALLKETLDLDNSTNALVGKAGGKVTVIAPSLDATVIRFIPSSEPSAELSAGVDGLWGVSLTVVPNGPYYSGIATINLSNGKHFKMSVTGTYSIKTD